MSYSGTSSEGPRRRGGRRAPERRSALRIREAVLTPVAFADPPLLNVMGVHEPYALRGILQLVCDDGIVGLGESYGDLAFLDRVREAVPELLGHDAFDLQGIRATLERALAGRVVTDQHGLTGGFSARKTAATVFSLFETACLDAQGRALGVPVCELLGGRARDRVDFSAYLFYKYAAHAPDTGAPADPWGEVLTPEALVEEARRMIGEYGFRSIKLKGGVLEPERETEGVRALAEAFPGHPLRIDPNAAWTVDTSLRVAEQLDGVLEYLEDPTPGIAGMAEVAARAPMPLATNMCVVSHADLEPALRARAIGVLLSDHHYWGGIRATQALSTVCESFGVGLSMHSNSHLGISLAAMVHTAAATPHLSYACDTHWPWKTTDVIAPGQLTFTEGALTVPDRPGLGIDLDPDALARAHETYERSGLTHRDDVTYMRRFVPHFTPNTARW
ncbi:glucarate dehydratase [Streptomyces albus]|uniref:glucarate dehydratase n=1 Tax=Streptomyces albus (strain ATCC 21838 / DSM 41398 / FERM P-419 / JCM 4703 / NBRC 107858) TaxID=1081613 RepID=A0A0B5EY95_STRA4|nr:glucarate dehydratase [Streptomyces albus]AOU78577.1 glucarate dehydratase [Streptomyces albus]AYN34319.1 glucarate dehydratase [Streptomyces albus]